MPGRPAQSIHTKSEFFQALNFILHGFQACGLLYFSAKIKSECVKNSESFYLI
jgi:hypothetical protein